MAPVSAETRSAAQASADPYGQSGMETAAFSPTRDSSDFTPDGVSAPYSPPSSPPQPRTGNADVPAPPQQNRGSRSLLEEGEHRPLERRVHQRLHVVDRGVLVGRAE